MGKVIFNSDDFGYSKGVNYGIIDSYTGGILTSATIMANMPGFDHAVELAHQYPGLGIGVHLTLTCGAPLLCSVPSLMQEDGTFCKKSEYDNGYIANPDEIRREWDAQIDKVLRSGIQPTHLDSHHHIHTYPPHRDIVVALARKYDLPARSGYAGFIVPGDVSCVAYFEEQFDQVGYPPEESQLSDIEAYFEELMEKMRIYETVEVMCHPAYLDDMLLEGSSFSYPRVKEVETLIRSAFARQVREDAAIELVCYRDL